MPRSRVFFVLAPWVFFVVGSGSYHAFVFGEKNVMAHSNFLLTKPLTDWQLVFYRKYFAGLVLVLLALIPTIVFFHFYLSVRQPCRQYRFRWNNGFRTLVYSFLAAILHRRWRFFASAITDNPLISFLLAVVVCFFLYLGFRLVKRHSCFAKYCIHVSSFRNKRPLQINKPWSNRLARLDLFCCHIGHISTIYPYAATKS